MEERDRKLVSIIVPVYNVHLYLSQCLDSLRRQTYQKIEVILIDDGSTDGSGEICDNYAESDSRIRVFHKKNQGVSAARNDGIERAQGKYLIFVDADDYIRPELIEVYMQATEPGITTVCEMTTDEKEWRSFDPADWKQKTEYLEEKQFMEAYRSDHINSPVNKLYDASVTQKYKIRFPENMSLGEDLMFNLSYQKSFRGSWKILKCPFYYYRENREGSLSSSYRSGLFELQQETGDALLHFMQDTGIWNEENQKVYYEMYWDRLFLTARMCREYERTHPEEKRLKEILSHPVWKEVWQECRTRKVLNWKRRIKRICLLLYKIMS